MEKRIKDDNIRWRLRKEDKKLIEKAAKADGRTVSNWLEFYVLALAREQLEKAE